MASGHGKRVRVSPESVCGVRGSRLTVLRVVLELLGRDGGAEEVLEVLEDILLAGREGARLRVGIEVGHCVGAARATGLSWEGTSGSVHKLAGRWRPPYHSV